MAETPKFDFSDEQIENLIAEIWGGSVTLEELPQVLYFAVADFLKQAMYDGFGGTVADFDGKPLELITELRENIYMFSSARTFQQVKEMSDALTSGDKVLSFSEYKKAAADIYAKYNGGAYLQDDEKAGHLSAEYETAVTQGQNAENWVRINKQKELFPFLRKNVVDDENTCEICGPLSGFTARVDDPVWDELAGELHFRCRCFEEQLDLPDGEAEYDEDEKDKLYKSQTELMQPMFKHNVYNSGEIFNEQHPYFNVPKEYEAYAKRNFDMPIPEKD